MSVGPVWRPPRAGPLPFYSIPEYPAFPYCMLVPRERPRGPAPLIVAMHGSDRRPETLRGVHTALCNQTGAVLLLPLFPIGSVAPDDEPGYKICAFRGMRYDEAVLAMVADAARRVPLVTDRFMMTGFSGGAQFVMRFLFIHPGRLNAVSIGAPGYVTLLDESLPWWAGTGGFKDVFGHDPDIAALRRVAIQLVVGTMDTDTRGIPIPDGDPQLMQGIARSGATRIARILSLEASLRAAGCDPQLAWVDGAAHALRDIFPPVEAFLRQRLPAISRAEPVPS